MPAKQPTPISSSPTSLFRYCPSISSAIVYQFSLKYSGNRYLVFKENTTNIPTHRSSHKSFPTIFWVPDFALLANSQCLIAMTFPDLLANFLAETALCPVPTRARFLNFPASFFQKQEFVSLPKLPIPWHWGMLPFSLAQHEKGRPSFWVKTRN
jgi:hypothetical protein